MQNLKSTYIKRIILFFLIINTGIAIKPSYAQLIPTEVLEEKTKQYNSNHPNDVLYITTDKMLYAPTETIWFSGHIIENTLRNDTIQADILSLALIKDDDLSVEIRKNYLLTNNYCVGSLTLSDSIPDGNYVLVAYSNIVDSEGEPIHSFKKMITIVRPSPMLITIDAHIIENHNKDTIFIASKVFFPEKISLRNRHSSEINYHVSNGRSRTAKINVIGEAILEIPVSEIRSSDQILHMTVIAGREKKNSSIMLPKLPPDTTLVEFYPEGSNLISGIRNRIAWKVEPSWNENPSVKALLFENNIIIDTIMTDNDGIGLFSLTPQNNNRYTLKILKEDSLSTPTVHDLPVHIPSGVALELDNAVANDTLRMTITSTEPKSINIVITNIHDRSSILTAPISITKERKARIPLSGIHKGLNLLNILDDENNLLATRLFFAHYNQKSIVSLNTNAENYGTRDSVLLRISLKDDHGHNIAGLFTVKCVHLSRLDTILSKGIASYYYTTPFRDDHLGSQDSSIALYSNKDQLEKQLFFRHTASNYLQRITTPENALDIYGKYKLTPNGKVHSVNNRRIKRPMSILVFQGNAISTIETDSEGKFTPYPEQITIPEDHFLHTAVMDRGKKSNVHGTIIEDPMEQPIDFFNKTPFHQLPLKTLGHKRSNHQLYQSLEMPQLIETVTVKARSVRHIYGYGLGAGANRCGDWVCPNNILNCSNHPPSTPGSTHPIEGALYSGRVYAGCIIEDGIHDDITPIYYTREFYGMPHSNNEEYDPEEMHYMSTILWEPMVLASGQKPTEFSFYTSDLKGYYIIQVEGFAENGDFIFAKKVIRVGDEIL